MTYPKIYSLSTVGMIKHYNHDYLFHHLRTDFIGPNGVGKSILADLLQLMFIYDKELIKFGTEDVKETRFIHTLPYKTSCAYCFLNIIIDKERFITIGIQVPNQERKRIVPFVIARSADLNSEKGQLALRREELLFSKDFINDGVIPELPELAERLWREKELKVSFFKTREAVQDYYRFLSNKDILPINLSRETNLKAFAKVIQSFSKAKTLKLSGKEASKNLKAFLFDAPEDDVKTEFENENKALEKVLREYKRFNDAIQLLSSKLKRLVALRQQYADSQRFLKDYKVAEIGERYHALNTQRAMQEECLRQGQQQREEWSALQTTIKKLPRLEAILKNGYEKAESNFEQIHRYKQIVDLIHHLDTEIIAIQIMALPPIDHSWKDHHVQGSMTLRTVDQLKEDLAFAAPYLNAYTTPGQLEAARKKQLEELEVLNRQLHLDKEKKESLLRLFRNHKEDSLLSWYVNKLPVLDADQMQVVLHFATLPTHKMEAPENGMRLVDPDKLAAFTTVPAKGGLWLESGPLSEYITYNEDARLLMNHAELKTHLQLLVDRLTAEVATIDRQLGALEAIRDGLDYDTALFAYRFDPRISEAAKIGQLKKAISYLLQKEENLSALHAERNLLQEERSGLQQRFQLSYNEPEVVERDLKRIRDRWTGRIKKLARYGGQKEAEEMALQKEVSATESRLETLEAKVRQTGEDFNQLCADYYKVFQELASAYENTAAETGRLKTKFDETYDAYKSLYVETAAFFEETRGEGSVEVRYEIKAHSYSFSVLERALLGNKIKSTDDITAALQEANNNRTQIADNIRDSMIKLFSRTAKGYRDYKTQVQTINAFFINRKISGKYSFYIEFEPNPTVKIEDIEKMSYDIRQAAIRGELQFDHSITDFLEEFFKKIAKLKEAVPIAQLLDPKTYFHLSTKLEDEWGEDISGSTGESYSAIALLGVARLATQNAKQKGLRFIILEELGSMDNTNFNIFPAIAEEFQYQIITMAPHTFNIGLSEEWFAHHLIKGKVNDKINYVPSLSFFKTKDASEYLAAYLHKVSG